jgi:hypothetical protein
MLSLGVNLVEFKRNYVGGLNTYALELIEELEKRNLKINIFTNKNSSEFLKKRFKNSNIFILHKKKITTLSFQFFCIIFNFEKLFCLLENRYYKNIKKIIENNSDVFYCPLSYLKPYNLNIPTICSPHDLQHLHFPKYFNYLRLKYRIIAFNLTIKKANLIQASSNFIKKDIERKFKINKNKIIIINEGVSNKFTYSNVNFKKNNYIFFPAQLWHHKNHITVFNSLKLIYKKYRLNLKLVMVGEKFNAHNDVLDFIEKNKDLNIQYLSKVSFRKLLILYKNSRLVISPSLHESSSLPILEACKIGRAVICSDIKPNKELARKLKLNLFKSEDPVNLSQVILKLWSNKKFQKNQIKFNKRMINNFSWEGVSKKYEKNIYKLANLKKAKKSCSKKN